MLRLFVLLACVTADAILNSILVRELSLVTDIAKNVHSLVLIDIDNTAFQATEFYGSIDYFVHLMRGHMASHNVDAGCAGNAIYPEWIASQRNATVQLRDRRLPEHVRTLRSRGVHVYGFTARRYALANITLAQLAALGVHFGHPATDGARYTKLLRGGEAWFERGVMFGHEGNDKGVVLRDWMRWLRTSVGARFHNVVLADDTWSNIVSVDAACWKMRVEFHGLHFPM